jgi:hypothetical protein
MMTHQDGRRRSELRVTDQRLTVTQLFPLARGLCIAVALSMAISLAGCAAMQQRIGGWFGAATPTPTPTLMPQARPAAERRVYYVGAEGLKVYSEPSASSKVVGKLALHEKVTRSRLERGFAYVESTTTGTRGWVNNSRLIWRLPSVPTTSAPAPPEPGAEEPVVPAAGQPEAPVAPEAPPGAEEQQEPVAPEAPPAVEEQQEPMAPEAPAPRTPTATPQGVAPSIFNPY